MTRRLADDLGQRIIDAAEVAAKRYRPFGQGGPGTGDELTPDEERTATDATVEALLRDPGAARDGNDLAGLALRVFSRVADANRKRATHRAKLEATFAPAPRPRKGRRAEDGLDEVEAVASMVVGGSKPRAPRRHVAAGYAKAPFGLKRSHKHPEVRAAMAWRYSTDDPLDALCMTALAAFVGQHAHAFEDPSKRRRVSALAMLRARRAFTAIMGYPAEEHAARSEQMAIATAIESALTTRPQPPARHLRTGLHFELPEWLTTMVLAEAITGSQLRGGQGGGGRGRRGAVSPEVMALRLVNAERKRRGLGRLRPLAKLGS